MFKRILVAVDGSKSALDALKQAVELQKLSQSELYIICVYKHHSLFSASLSIARPEELRIPDEALSQYARDVVEHAKAIAVENGAPTVKGYTDSGRPSKTIVEFASKHDIDLIVLGARGTHGAKDGILLGSVSQRVAGMAKCPILLV
ncbi:Nucleotide-binding universal stress protein, UspA family [Marinobacter daqiaonensis]|uniref:Nucleotide-binding universal stress protein, UspA family n=1 Tax=Marinobacter daqiaonensis TaxID=650891 RepID=A0A1I6GUW7_9GAMM|nr:universal stress protein [Marinobacter daqiaonensis]SFR45879.1 Nucleotide-binding universal stress protein, UspA family [Marinobacter daqiaonensis]